MKTCFPLFLGVSLCAISCKSFSQTLRYCVSMPYISLGAYSISQADPFFFTSNQAALARVKSAGVAVFGERRFLLVENSVYGLAAVIPTGKGNFGVQVNYAGFKNFSENKLGMAYARKLGSAVDLGVQFNYYGYRVAQYGNATALNFELGAIIHFSDKFQGGIHLYNPVGGKFGKGKEMEKLAAAYKLGLGYDASENFYVSSEIIKEEDKPVNVVGGVQYQLSRQFFARGGFMTETGSGFAGLGLGWKNFRMDISGSYHPQLGFSPGILMVVNFKEVNP